MVWNVLQRAQQYAHLILAWHQNVGIERAAQRLSEEALHRYRSTIAQLAQSDLASRETLHSIARTQLSGIFEWFYGETIPISFLPGELRELHPDSLPLYVAANQILECLESDDSDGPHIGRKTVQAESQEQLLNEARAFYREFDAEAQGGLSGVELLLSCSLERAQSGQVTLLGPEILGFSVVLPNSRANDLLDHVRSGHLTIEVQGDTGTEEEPHVIHREG